MKTRFFHFGDRSIAQHKGIITVAAELIDEKLYFGIAYCSPKDRFKRKLGLKIAQGRLYYALAHSRDMVYSESGVLKYGKALYVLNSFETITRIFMNAYMIGKTPVWVDGKILPQLKK